MVSYSKTLELANLIVELHSLKKSRSANKVMQDAGLDYFHARGIQNQFGIDYYSFLEEIQKEDSVTLEDLESDIIIRDESGLETENIIDNIIKKLLAIKEDVVSESEIPVSEQGLPRGTEKIAEGAKTDSKKPVIKQTPNSFEAGFSLNIPIMEMLSQAVESNMDDILSNVQNTIREEAKKLQPNVIHINKSELGTVEGKTHAQFKKVSNLLANLGQVFISGDTGSGKTHLAEQVAKGFGLPFGFMSCSAGISEAHILGRMLMDGTYVSTDFVDTFENGGVFLLDEVDSADANTLLVINSAIANGKLHLPNRKGNQTAKRHSNFYLICSANTWGSGSVEYSGREYLDAAFMNRFSMSKVHVTYDENLEQQITSNHEVCGVFQKMRKALKGTERFVSTRTIVDAYKLAQSGLSTKDLIEQFCTDFNEEEISKVKSAVKGNDN